MRELGKSETVVLEYLKNKKVYVSPTEIGKVVGGYNVRGILRNRSWASPICQRLVSRGLVLRNEYGWYKFNEYVL